MAAPKHPVALGAQTGLGIANRSPADCTRVNSTPSPSDQGGRRGRARTGTVPVDRMVYDGRTLLGSVQEVLDGFIALDAEGRLLGTFATACDAAKAVQRGAPR